MNLFFRVSCVVLLLLELPHFSKAQTPPPAQKDTQAVYLLTQCLNSAGGIQTISAIHDFTASGSITYYWAGQEVIGSATVRALGIDEVRLDAQLPSGIRSWAVRRGAGSVKDLDGTVKVIPYQNSVALMSLTFPYLQITSALANPVVSIIDLGMSTIGGHQVYQIRTQETFPADVDPDGTLSQLTIKDFLIDSTTLLVLATRDKVHPEDRLNQSIAHEVRFTDFQLISGVLVPFSFAEFVGGQRTWSVQLDRIAFNSGLTDSVFSF